MIAHKKPVLRFLPIRFKSIKTFLFLLVMLSINCKQSAPSMRGALDHPPFEIAPIVAPFEMPEMNRPEFRDLTFKITDYGAVGDGFTQNSDAINKAITACSNAGGGRVIVPAGRWLTGAIHLQSNVDLHLENNAEIHFSNDPADYLPVVFTRWAGFECYNYSPLIYARDCENIAITGPGKIYGNGESWWPWFERQSRTASVMYNTMVLKGIGPEQRVFGTPEAGLRPQLISPINCRNVLLEGFTIAEPGPFWTIHIVYCENVIVRDLSIHTKGGPNTDGINLDSSCNALVEHCRLDVGDDAVCLKSGVNEDGWRVGKPTKNIIVRNNTALSSHGGIVIGSEMSGGVSNVLCYDCVFDGSDRGIRLKSNSARGGVVENIFYRDITMRDIRNEAVRINTNYGAWLAAENADAFPAFRNITIQNIDCNGAKTAVSIKGVAEMPIRNLVMKNINISAKQGMQFHWVDGLELENVTCTTDSGGPYTFENCSHVQY